MGFTIDEQNVFEVSYLETATWSSTDDDGEPIDANPRVSEAYSQREVFSAEALRQVAEDCSAFLATGEELLRTALATGYDLGQAGHDFWLSRNRHGAGFWDRGLGETGDALHELATPFGEANLYWGDDDLLHLG